MEQRVLENGYWTVLHYAAWTGGMDNVRLLLHHGADPNARDVIGRTPMSNAANRDRSDVIAILIDAGADVEDLQGEHSASQSGILQRKWHEN
jgi:ankyrin repeat protein